MGIMIIITMIMIITMGKIMIGKILPEKYN